MLRPIFDRHTDRDPFNWAKRGYTKGAFDSLIDTDDGFRDFFDAGGDGGGSGEGGEGGGSGEGGEGGGGGDPPKLPEGAIYLKDFREALPEDIRGHASLAKIETFSDLGRSFVNAQGLIGKDLTRVVEIPGVEDAEGRRGILTKLGLPEDAKGYNLKTPEGAPENLAVDKPLGVWFGALAHTLGALPEQASGFYNGFVEYMMNFEKDELAKQNSDAETRIRGLEAELGGAFDQEVAAANFAIDKVFGEETRKQFDAVGLGSQPAFLKGMAKIGKMLAEDASDEGGGGGPDFSGKLSPDQARSKGSELLRQAMDEKNPAEAKRLNEEAQRWFKMANPKVISNA